MSYFGNNSNPLSFTSYGQGQLPQRNLGGLNALQQPSQLGHLTGQGGQNDPNSAAAAAAVQQQQVVHQAQQPSTTGPESQNDVQQSGQQVQGKKERKNRPGQKFGAKKKSWVWSWFVQDSQDPNIAACDYCGKIITRLPSDKGSPKKLSEHLKTHKLTKDSINNSRPIPIDGNGITYAPNGIPLGYPSNFQHHPGPSSNPPQINSEADDLNLVKKNAAGLKNYKNRSQINNIDASLAPFGMASNRRFLSTEFDNSPYSAMKFHKHLMKFLTENKLSINVIKSHSFQQLIYDLRSDSVTELLELTGLYSSLLEVSRFDGTPGQSANDNLHEANSSIPSVNEATVVNTLAQAVEQKVNAASSAT
ncbi:uncharacterized protein PRCAT00003041001 [Priceomyces carsonii]|uniref:uncharacterized protein n=1 Tax=Priceomyces carsonii TaxID=28549 RepID=UPI002ED80DB8|nr:unnamed protein product [Priceomyces carsonii]